MLRLPSLLWLLSFPLAFHKHHRILFHRQLLHRFSLSSCSSSQSSTRMLKMLCYCCCLFVVFVLAWLGRWSLSSSLLFLSLCVNTSGRFEPPTLLHLSAASSHTSCRRCCRRHHKAQTSSSDKENQGSREIKRYLRRKKSKRYREETKRLWMLHRPYSRNCRNWKELGIQNNSTKFSCFKHILILKTRIRFWIKDKFSLSWDVLSLVKLVEIT